MGRRTRGGPLYSEELLCWTGGACQAAAASTGQASNLKGGVQSEPRAEPAGFGRRRRTTGPLPLAG
eukprot:10766221-Alexandrium_andersonii.AAC.1